MDGGCAAVTVNSTQHRRFDESFSNSTKCQTYNQSQYCMLPNVATLCDNNLIMY